MSMPKRNAFDGVYGYDEKSELAFINFKKLGNFVKKSAKKVGKVAKKVIKAPIKAAKKVAKKVDIDFVQAGKWAGATTKDLAKRADVDVIQAGKWTGQQVKENPALAIGLAAGGAALTFGAGPLIMAGVKGAGGMLASGGGMIAGAAKAALPTAISMGKDILTGGPGPQMPTEYTEEDITQHYQQVGQQALNDGEAVGQTSQYQEAVERLRAQGYTDAQIAQQWMTSQAYYKQALPEVQNSIYPEVYQQYAAQMPPRQAQIQAYRDSEEIADATVRDVQNTATGLPVEKLVLPAALLTAAFLFTR